MWNVIFVSLWLPSLCAVRFLIARNVVSRVFLFDLNILLFMCGIWFSIPISLLLIGWVLGLLPFSGVMLRVLRSVSMSFHVNFVASPSRAPVSFSICRSAFKGGLLAAISVSASCSVGMNGILSSLV